MRDFSKFMLLPSADEEHQCYEAFYDATSNEALSMTICPVCARERMAKDGEDTLLLSDPSITEILSTQFDDGHGRNRDCILRHLLQVDEGTVNCWMCFDCIKALERGTLPKLALANNLCVGDVPPELMDLTIPEQLLIARHYPRCYIFKLFPRDTDTHISPDQLHAGMAGNASLFELNTQEVVEMVEGQRMPSAVHTLASVIAITFVSSRTLPVDWLKKTFRVRRQVIHDALSWLQNHNPIYADIQIDNNRLEQLPEDDMPEELLTVVRHEMDDEVAESERASYVNSDNMGDDEDEVGELLKL